MKNKFILGTVQFGLEYGINNSLGKPSKQEVFQTLSLASASGITMLDTADHYGNSQTLIGEFNRSVSNNLRVNTKFKVNNLSIREQLDSSLQTLGVTSVEVYFYHSFHDFVQYPQVRLELQKLKAESRVNKIGVSVYSNNEIEIAAEAPEVDVIQIPFNLLDNRFQRGKSIERTKELGKSIQSRSVFLQGLLFKDPKHFPAYLVPLKNYVRQLQSLADKNGLTMEMLCLSYALSQPDIDHVIIGVDNADQLKKNLTYLASPLDDAIMKEINSIKVIETELLLPTNWK
jgi:uncharacterized protein